MADVKPLMLYTKVLNGAVPVTVHVARFAAVELPIARHQYAINPF